MADRSEQIEALTTLKEFNVKLLNNMKIIVKELRGQRLDDTDKFQKSIIDAINWEVTVMNGTMELLNEGKTRINKEQFNDKMIALGDAVKAAKDDEIADGMEALIPEFEGLGQAVEEALV